MEEREDIAKIRGIFSLNRPVDWSSKVKANVLERLFRATPSERVAFLHDLLMVCRFYELTKIKNLVDEVRKKRKREPQHVEESQDISIKKLQTPESLHCW